jgi:glycerophosphoryl diester phosphodiesterase
VKIRVRQYWKPTAVTVGLLLLFIFLNNTSAFTTLPAGSPVVFAHRGVGQRYSIPIESSSCIAVQMLPPEHGYLENTIPSMRAAFDQGASVVEFDIHSTTDNQFAVFHDRTLDCKTNGAGLTRSHTMATLKALDVGYGYTFDGGHTFPFRGKGVGLMPSMAEVFETFPDRSFLIDVKDNQLADAALLVEHLSRLSADRLSQLTIFARGDTIPVLRERFPALRVFSAGSVASCLVQYIAYGWTGLVPGQCRNSAIFVPINVAPWLWGWPGRFMARMGSVNSPVIAMGPFPSREISPGLDTPEMMTRLPDAYNGGIWTNELALTRYNH